MSRELSGVDVVTAAESLAVAVDVAAGSADPWAGSAGILEWDCRSTFAHVVDCLNWYAANLARRSTRDVEIPELPVQSDPLFMVDAFRSSAAVLAAVVDSAGPDDRGWHPYGIADRTGFAAMGCDEVLVHAWDLAAGLGFEYQPPPEVVALVVRRLFPWAPAADQADPWDALLWANGRIPLGDQPPETKWLWHCAPLETWDGQIRRIPMAAR